MKEEVPDILMKIAFIALALLFWAYMGISILVWGKEVVRTQPSESGGIENSMYVYAKAPHYYFNPIIDCLIQYESGGNSEALNKKDTDGLPKYGILQFGERTFNEFCVEKYGLYNNIWSVSSQKMCAHRMIEDGYGHRWGTWKMCN